MIITQTKRKIIVTKISIVPGKRFTAFEIRLPANVTKIAGILVTASKPWELSVP